MEAAADCTEDLCGSPACWAWVPLEHREAVLVVHEVTDRVGEGNVKGRPGWHKNVSWEAQQAPAWKRVRSLCGQHHGCGFVFPLWAAGICGLGCGAALEVGGTKVNCSEECQGGQGNPQWGVRETFPTSRY